jgi:hypothetical protein
VALQLQVLAQCPQTTALPALLASITRMILALISGNIQAWIVMVLMSLPSQSVLRKTALMPKNWRHAAWQLLGALDSIQVAG